MLLARRGRLLLHSTALYSSTHCVTGHFDRAPAPTTRLPLPAAARTYRPAARSPRHLQLAPVHDSTRKQVLRLDMTAPDIEAKVRALVLTALKQNFAISKDKQWVFDFVGESILVELAQRGSDLALDTPSETHPASAGAGSQCGAVLPSLLPCDLPDTTEQAEALWSPLLYDNLDSVDAEDMTAFCEQLLGSLSQLAVELAEGSEGSDEEEEGACEMCDRVMRLTKHHLIPREVHKEWKKKGASFEELQAGAMICRPCHSAVHRVADNKTLARDYSTVDKLLTVPSIQRHISWARKQKVIDRPQGLSTKPKRRR